jgi:hypothetical protein
MNEFLFFQQKDTLSGQIATPMRTKQEQKWESVI